MCRKKSRTGYINADEHSQHMWSKNKVLDLLLTRGKACLYVVYYLSCKSFFHIYLLNALCIDIYIYI